MIVRLAEGNLKTKYGHFKEVLYYGRQKETIAMIMGEIYGGKEIFCRVHSTCLHGHYFNSIECDCQEQMNTSQALIQRAGRGIIILMEQEGKGNGHYALLHSIRFKRQGDNQSEAYIKAGFKNDNRDFSSAGKILKDQAVKSVKMLTNNPDKVNTLESQGITVSGIQKITLK
jgi:GTP cyclohydrolase II